MMTKSSVDRKLSKYGEKCSLRFHIPEQKYHLSQSLFPDKPMLVAEYDKENRHLAVNAFEMFEGLYQNVKYLEILHMGFLFNTSKSYKGEVSKRYKYSEKTDNLYDMANHYGQYHKIVDKKEAALLLNESNTAIDILQKENEQLKQQLDDLRTYSNDEFEEAKYISNIYKEKGFCGVIEYAKDKLQHYGVVKEVEKGLWVMITGGWSDNEFWLHCLNNPVSIFGMKHYRGYLRGGAFYFTEKPRGDVEIILKGDVE